MRCHHFIIFPTKKTDIAVQAISGTGEIIGVGVY